MSRGHRHRRHDFLQPRQQGEKLDTIGKNGNGTRLLDAVVELQARLAANRCSTTRSLRRSEPVRAVYFRTGTEHGRAR